MSNRAATERLCLLAFYLSISVVNAMIDESSSTAVIFWRRCFCSRFKTASKLSRAACSCPSEARWFLDQRVSWSSSSNTRHLIAAQSLHSVNLLNNYFMARALKFHVASCDSWYEMQYGLFYARNQFWWGANALTLSFKFAPRWGVPGSNCNRYYNTLT